MKKYIINLLGYLGVGFIGGAISHGFFSETRSFIMAGIGIVLFLISEFLREGEKDYVNTIIFGLFYSLCVGMVSGGFQHFLDSPQRSMYIIPIGFVLGYIIYVLKNKESKLSTSNIFIALIVGLGLFLTGFAAYKYIPASLYTELADHHSEDNHGEGKKKEIINNVGNSDNLDSKYYKLGFARMNGKKDADILEHCQMMPSMEGCSEISKIDAIKSNNSANINNNMNMGNHEMNHADMVNSEFEFVYLMIPHHQEAVDTSLWYDEYATPGLNGLDKLAKNIVSGQKLEIDMMKGRLSNQYSGQKYNGMGYMTMMRPLNFEGTGESGWKNLKIQRAQDMIKHHQGAVDMANKLLQIMDKQDPLIKLTEQGNKFRTDLRNFANAIIVAQSKEINDMKNIISEINQNSTTGENIDHH